MSGRSNLRATLTGPEKDVLRFARLVGFDEAILLLREATRRGPPSKMARILTPPLARGGYVAKSNP